MNYQLGKILLLGSGETSHPGGQAFETLIHGMKAPIRIRLLETPAGFELNSARVAGRVADFLQIRLQNYQPDIQLVAARRKGGEFSTNSPLYCDQIADADVVFFGAGSPSYTIHQLADSRIWQSIQAAFFQGAYLALASAATISLGKYALPVYEIYKVGEDPFWNIGLNFLSHFGLNVSFIPHWNNNDGGAELDTSRCFMGRERFEKMASELPMDHPIVGLDEQTGLIMDFHNRTGKVVGKGGVHVLAGEQTTHFGGDDEFRLEKLGEIRNPDVASIPEDIWSAVEQIRKSRQAARNYWIFPWRLLFWWKSDKKLEQLGIGGYLINFGTSFLALGGR